MSKMDKKIVVIIAAVTAFIIAGGITTFLLLKDRGVAAVVNGAKIRDEQIDEEISKIMAQYESNGMPFPPEQFIEMRNSVVENMITREILIQESTSYEVDNEEIETQIASFKERFPDEETFVEALKSQGMELETFKETLLEDMRIQKFIQENVPSEIVIPEDEMMVFYNENSSYFIKPERIDASHILVKLENSATAEEKEIALKKIERVQMEIRNGADFGDLAIAESEGPSAPQGGNLGEFPKGQMVGAFEDVAFSLPVGEISGVVETQFGYHIIKLNNRFPESKDSFENVKSNIENYLKQEKSQTIMLDFIDKLKEAATIRIIEYKQPEVKEETEEVTPEPEITEE